MDNPYKKNWKYFKSFFKPNIKVSRSTQYNPNLEVVFEYGKLKLNSFNVNYSFGSLHVAFEETFNNLDIKNRDYKNILILGLGAGSVPAILASYGKDYNMVGIEIDPMVIELAQQYFNLNYHKNLDIIIDDAQNYIQNCNQKFDLIIVDLFIDYEVPKFAETFNFLSDIEKCLSPKGMIVYNRLIMKATLDSTDQVIKLFSSKFANSEVFKTLANYMLIYDASKN